MKLHVTYSIFFNFFSQRTPICHEEVAEVCYMWPEVKIVHGKPRYFKSQSSVKCANQDIENILSARLHANKTRKMEHTIATSRPVRTRLCSAPKLQMGLSSSSIPECSFKRRTSFRRTARRSTCF